MNLPPNLSFPGAPELYVSAITSKMENIVNCDYVEFMGLIVIAN